MSHYRWRDDNDQDINNKQNVVIKVVNKGDNNKIRIAGAVAKNNNRNSGDRGHRWHGDN